MLLMASAAQDGTERKLNEAPIARPIVYRSILKIDQIERATEKNIACSVLRTVSFFSLYWRGCLYILHAKYIIASRQYDRCKMYGRIAYMLAGR